MTKQGPIHRTIFSLLSLLLGTINSPAGGVYWSDRGTSQLKSMNFDGSELRIIPLKGAISTPGGNLRGIAVDVIGNHLFWADNGFDKINKALLTGDSAISILTLGDSSNFPADIRIDPIARHLYWCDQTRNTIQRSNLDGTATVTIISNAAPSGPYFLDLDSISQRLYWGDFDGGSIYSSRFDGAQIKLLITGINSTRGICIDQARRMLYWVNRNDKKIQRCPLSELENGTINITNPAVETIFQGLDTPHGIAMDPIAGKVYWADTGTNPGTGIGEHSINRGSVDGTRTLEVLASGVEPWDLDLDLRVHSFLEWRARFYRRNSPDSESGLYADPDGDGLLNLQEYVHATNPLLRDDRTTLRIRAEEPTSTTALSPTITFMQRTDLVDVTISVETSNNLTDWVTTSANPENRTVQTSSLYEGIQHTKIQLPMPGQAETHYFRLKLLPKPSGRAD